MIPYTGTTKQYNFESNKKSKNQGTNKRGRGIRRSKPLHPYNVSWLTLILVILTLLPICMDSSVISPSGSPSGKKRDKDEASSCEDLSDSWRCYLSESKTNQKIVLSCIAYFYRKDLPLKNLLFLSLHIC